MEKSRCGKKTDGILNPRYLKVRSSRTDLGLALRSQSLVAFQVVASTPVLRQIVCALKIARFPASDGFPVQVIFTLERQKSLPGNPRGIPVYVGWRNPDVFATLGWFGLGSLVVPVVQPSQSYVRKDVT